MILALTLILILFRLRRRLGDVQKGLEPGYGTLQCWLFGASFPLSALCVPRVTAMPSSGGLIERLLPPGAADHGDGLINGVHGSQ